MGAGRCAGWILAWALPLSSTAQATHRLDRPDAELAEPFTSVRNVRELRDGRVLVLDVRDATVQIARFGPNGDARIVGRHGQGPGEYMSPMALLPMPGDSSAVYDSGNRRMLVIDPEGRPTGTFALEVAGTGAGPVRVLGNPRGADARGRIYIETFQARPTRGGPAVLDTVPVLRYDRRGRRADTVAWLHPVPTTVVTSRIGSATSFAVYPQPFGKGDAWAVSPAARVAVIRASDYQVEWIEDGPKRRRGPVTSFEPIPVTAADKKAVLDDLGRTPRGVALTLQDGRTLTGAAPPPVAFEWPSAKAPFEPGAAWIRGDGELWIARYRAFGDSVPRFDLFDGTGVRTGQVALLAGLRLVGLGEHSAYAIRTDSDGLEHLQRYRLPW